MAFRPYLARIWSSVRSRRSSGPPGGVCLAQQVQLDASLVLGDQIEAVTVRARTGLSMFQQLRQGDGGLGQLPGQGGEAPALLLPPRDGS